MLGTLHSCASCKDAISYRSVFITDESRPIYICHRHTVLQLQQQASQLKIRATLAVNEINRKTIQIKCSWLLWFARTLAN